MPLSPVVCPGCYWIITAPSVDLVIRSTVSIMFVQNVDEVSPSSLCSIDEQAAAIWARNRGAHADATDTK